MQTICTSLQTDNHTNISSLNFYRPDALPGGWRPTNSVIIWQLRYLDIYLFYARHRHSIDKYLDTRRPIATAADRVVTVD